MFIFNWFARKSIVADIDPDDVKKLRGQMAASNPQLAAYISSEVARCVSAMCKHVDERLNKMAAPAPRLSDDCREHIVTGVLKELVGRIDSIMDDRLEEKVDQLNSAADKVEKRLGCVENWLRHSHELIARPIVDAALAKINAKPKAKTQPKTKSSKRKRLA